MDALETYREASPGLRREFTLYSDRVVIVGYHLGGKDFLLKLSLQEVVPDYGYVLYRSPRCKFGFLLFAALATFLWIFLGPLKIPPHSAPVPVTAGLASASLAVALYYLPKSKAYKFWNKSGQIVFDIIESGPDQARCQEFVELVTKVIRQAKSANA